LLNTLLLDESTESVRTTLAEIAHMIAAQPESEEVGRFPKVVAHMRAEGILANPPDVELAERYRQKPYDLTRNAISFPAPRSARLQMLARGDVGSLLTYAYSSVRGYGDAHPTLGELRYGALPVEVSHPQTGEAYGVGDIVVTECEIVSKIHTKDAAAEAANGATSHPKFGLGYGFTFGQNEVKAISMAILDRVLSAAREGTLAGERGPAADEEFVLQHIDGIEASGFTAHYKLPHYVDFESNMNVLERAVQHTASHTAQDTERKQQVLKRLESANAADLADHN
jgi:alpha-D-ribose 1-methylphosphonate 5-triphosphate synthase subunit PhnI